jgi:CSLREA domain-containing protein
MSHSQSRRLSPVRFRHRPRFDIVEDRTLLSSFVVSNTGDSGPGSLRQAILDANAAQAASTISFDPTAFATPQTITLTSGQLELSDTTGTETITGPAAGVTVSADGASLVFQVDSAVKASISGLTITGGGNASSGGGLYNLGTATLTKCTITGNSAGSGGGLNNHGTATLTSCTISDNTAASSGGGLQTSGGTLKLTNCTLSGNSAGHDGGGLYGGNGGTATLADCTLSGNMAGGEGGGVYDNAGTSTSPTVTFGNTIVAGNTTGNLGPDVFGGFVSKGNNLIGKTDGSTGWVGADLTGTIASPLNPLLAPLANYGGPTQTMALLPGSPAIDAGSNSLIPSGVTTDGRGFSRIVNGTVDIGAFESSGFTIAATSGSGQSAGGWPTSSAFSAPLVVRVIAKNSAEPVAGGLVTFTAPASGATAELTGSPATLSAGGMASVTAARNGVTGSFIVSAKARGASGAASFLLTNLALVSIAISPGEAELGVGVSGQFTATGTYADGSTANITPYVIWSSATPSVATISRTGAATAQTPGSSAITASFAGVTVPADTLTVTVPNFVVNTADDDFGFSNGTTSLREAIAAADAEAGAHTIMFSLPAGSTTIHLLSPLPAITSPVVFDGTTQPGFAGTPLIDLTGQSLPISSEVTVRAVMIDGFDFGSAAVPEELALPSVSFPKSQGGSGGASDSYPFETNTGEDLTAVVQAQGVTPRLLLLDATGNVIVQSDGQSAAGGDDLINLYVPAGTYSLEVQDLGSAGTYSLTATAELASSPLQLLAEGNHQSVPSIVTGDFTADGHADLAAVIGGSVSVLLGNGDGTFAPPVTYAVGSNPTGLVAGDFTGGGHLDLAVANGGDNTVSVLMGNGDGTFQPQVTYAVGSDPQGIVAGDFTGGGHLDLAVSDSGSDTVSVLMGNGDGTFAPQVTYAVGENPAGIVAGDFTGQGRLDLAVVDSFSSTVSVLLGNGDGTFGPQVTYAVGKRPAGIVAGDFTGDGRLDLAVTNSLSNTVSVLLNNGDGSFAPQVTYNVGAQPSGIAAGDFTGDGDLDLAVTSVLGYVSVLLGYGDGTFRTPITAAVGGTLGALVAGDFFGDGRLDLAVAVNGTDFNQPTDGVSLLLGYGNGTFVPESGPLGNPVGAAPDAIVAGDFTGDGLTDLAVTNDGSSTVSVLLGNGDGTFAPQATYAVGMNPVGIVTGDWNGDGLLDLAVANSGTNTVSVLLGNGDGTFAPQVTYAVGSDPQAIVAGDFTGDGRTDLVVSDGDGIQILLGNGDGTFEPAKTIAPGLSGSLVAADFTKDGPLDLAVAGGGDTGTVSVLLGNGDGTFAPAGTYVVGTHPVGIVAGDFAGNGLIDLAVANEGVLITNPGSVSVLLGNGDGKFAPPVTYKLNDNPAAIVAGDFTGGGHLDLALTSQDLYGGAEGTELIYSTTLLPGNGDGTFASQTFIDSQNQYSGTAIAAADFIGDGHLGLAIVENASSAVSVLLGNGDGTFTNPNQLATTPHATPLVADVSGDGTADVLEVDSIGNILYRQGIPRQPGSFLPPVTVNPGNPSRDIAWLPSTSEGPVLASLDAQDDAISFYAYRDGGFVRLDGSLATGQFPAQITAAPLNGDGTDDLVVRNAGDGTLTVYFGSQSGSGFGGAAVTLDPPAFTAAVTLPVGLGVSDVEAVDTTGSGRLDLVVTNQLASELGILRNLGGGAFAPLEPYRAGSAPLGVNPGSTPEVSSIDATAGMAAGSITPGGPLSLVTINPGTNTLDVLAGLGGGRFANPVEIDTPSPASVLRMADFAGNGLSDLAVLTADGVSIYLADGKGGFLPPVTYAAGVDSTGLTVVDLLGNGKLDLLVGNAYGDVLILVGNGDGTFRPFEPVKQDIALAVADLTGNGVPDFVFADQSLNQVTVQYGTASGSAASSHVIGNQGTGILAPGAVLLAPLNPGDDIPDLIIANSGGNNVLVYPGLGNGQFGPPLNGTQGFPVGTDPTGLFVANLNGQPDLLVADTGSNAVSVLLGEGSGSSWTMVSGARVATDSGPVALTVGKVLPNNQVGLAVANSGADNVQIFPSVGNGYFNDQAQAITTVPVGQAPSSLFLGNFNGLGQGLATLNTGSNNGTLISNLGSANPVIQSFPTGGNAPTSGFAGDFTGNGFTDLVVGNNGDGALGLLMGGFAGLSLFQTVTSPEAPNPTDVSFGGVSGGLLSFYVSTAGHEAAMNLAFDLNASPEPEGGVASVAVTPSAGLSVGGVLSEATSGSVEQVALLLSLTGATLDLAATLLTVSVVETESGGALALTASSTAPGQSQAKGNGGGSGASGDELAENPEGVEAAAQAVVEKMPPWERQSMGFERAWERAREWILELESRGRTSEDKTPSGRPAVSRPPERPSPAPTQRRTEVQSEPASQSDAAAVDPTAPANTTSDRGQSDTGRAIDAALEDLAVDRAGRGQATRLGRGVRDASAVVEHSGSARVLVAVAAIARATWTLRGPRRPMGRKRGGETTARPREIRFPKTLKN